MTLYRQILISIVILFVLMFVGTVVINIRSASQFLEEQLESHAQDTATSLGLSLSPHMLGKDLPTMRSMVDAIFDRGYYREIKIVSTDGKTLIERRLPVMIENVPSWFVNAITLETPQADALIMAGWNQAAKVYVRSHPGFAYSELWRTTARILLWFSVAGIALAILMALALRVLLAPLKRVEEQAVAICERKYVVQDSLPKTRELKSVVLAMNRMTNKVKAMFTEQARTAERLRDIAYRDVVTGLGNRSYFDSQLQERLDSDHIAQGALFLIQVEGLKAINTQRGLEAGDQYLRNIATAITSITDKHADSAIARLTGGDFGVFFPEIAIEQVDRVAEAICHQIEAITVADMDDVVHANIGIVLHSSDEDMGVLMSKADSALRLAQRTLDTSWYIYQTVAGQEINSLSRAAWREKIERALQDEKLCLYRQSVRSINDTEQVLQNEVFVRLIEQTDQHIPAGLFMSLAEGANLASEIDKRMIERVLEHATGNASLDSYTLNVSPRSLHDEPFTEWLYDRLIGFAHPGKLMFECSETIVLQQGDAFRHFIDVLKGIGCAVGLDHFGRGFHDFGYLNSVRPDYVKIDAAYTRDLVKNQDKQFFVSALCGVAHSLDVLVIAQAVENQQQLDMLRSLNVDAVQGYLMDQPEPL